MKYSLKLPRITKTRLVIVGLIVMAIITIILRAVFLRSQPEIIPQVQLQKSYELPFHSLEFVVEGQAPVPPENFSIYSGQKIEKTPIEVAQYLGVTTALSETSFTDDTQMDSLVITPQNKIALYTQAVKGSDAEVAAFTPLQVDTAIQKATQFYTNLFGSTPITPDTTQLRFTSILHSEYEEVEKDTASVVTIPFEYRLDSYPVYIDTQRTLPAVISVNSIGKIVKAEFSLIQFIPTPIQSVPSISFEEAIQNKENITVLVVGKSTLERIPTSSIRKLTVHSIVLEYRLVSSQSRILPFYKGTGKALYTGSNTENTVEFIIPAIQVEQTR